jgi:hypothetical protein
MRGTCAGFVLLLLAATVRAAPVPASLDAFGEAAESAYDHAAAKEWRSVASDLKDLNAALKKMTAAKVPTDTLAPMLAQLSTAVAAQDRLAAMGSANALTRMAAEAERAYDVKVPVDILILDYGGREVGIQAERADAAKFAAVLASLHGTWDKIRPVVTAKGGGAKPAAAFTAALAALEANKDGAKLPAVVKLDRVDDLEAVF